ncbi:MAG: Tfp pilus assembly protein FimT/FimU [Pyrinomonadaceae bacterium]
MKKAFCKNGASASGFSLVEIFVVLVVMAILMVISVPYFYNYTKLYKSEDQSLKMMDLMREAGQLAITRRRTMRFEIDLTQNAMLIIDENGAGPDTRIKTIPLETTREVRVDIMPTGVARPNPPDYPNAVFAVDTLGHQFNGSTVTGNTVWACRFQSDGTTVNSAVTPVPINATIFVWPPTTYGATTPRRLTEVRAITMFGGTGAVRYWKHDGTALVPAQ